MRLLSARSATPGSLKKFGSDPSAMAGLDAMKGCQAWADRAHAVYEK
jgi:hypothetical protein